ncbi:hypothetical protein FNU76_05750 [Chitinimonas arctica]|uniref:DUF7660 domain-containing protein n=2 Tax=Chitinimonas arctica TaxID=2594795 RepID=A0A516SCL9_9NEIS|nr:hypothetical protein FNU76_05750 [Chitinimonas arctica]
MDLKLKTDTVSSRDDFIEFVDALRLDLSTNRTKWQNASLDDFLEALSAWVQDMDGYYLNNNLPIPTSPEWKTIAEMMLAAKFYE